MSKDTPHSTLNQTRKLQNQDKRKAEIPTHSNNETSLSSPTGSNVRLTKTAAHLKDIEKRLVNESAIDSERVQHVKTELASGKYSVDSDRVADKMIEFEKLLKR